MFGAVDQETGCGLNVVPLPVFLPPGKQALSHASIPHAGVQLVIVQARQSPDLSAELDRCLGIRWHKDPDAEIPAFSKVAEMALSRGEPQIFSN